MKTHEISTSEWPNNPLAFISDAPLPATPLASRPDRSEILSASIAGAGAIIDGLVRENARLSAELSALRGMKEVA